jgi:hypothetical protein
VDNPPPYFGQMTTEELIAATQALILTASSLAKSFLEFWNFSFRIIQVKCLEY